MQSEFVRLHLFAGELLLRPYRRRHKDPPAALRRLGVVVLFSGVEAFDVVVGEEVEPAFPVALVSDGVELFVIVLTVELEIVAQVEERLF